LVSARRLLTEACKLGAKTVRWSALFGCGEKCYASYIVLHRATINANRGGLCKTDGKRQQRGAHKSVGDIIAYGYLWEWTVRAIH